MRLGDPADTVGAPKGLGLLDNGNQRVEAQRPAGGGLDRGLFEGKGAQDADPVSGAGDFVAQRGGLYPTDVAVAQCLTEDEFAMDLQAIETFAEQQLVD